VVSQARFDPDDPVQRDQRHRRDEIATLTDPHRRLRRLVALSCETLARTSPVHAVIRGAADGHPFAADLYHRTLGRRIEVQSENFRAYLASAVRDGLTVAEAAEHYSALLSPELYQLLTVECGWSADRFETWVGDLLDRDLRP
jgi:hypothetical protein